MDTNVLVLLASLATALSAERPMDEHAAVREFMAVKGNVCHSRDDATTIYLTLTEVGAVRASEVVASFLEARRCEVKTFSMPRYRIQKCRSQPAMECAAIMQRIDGAIYYTYIPPDVR